MGNLKNFNLYLNLLFKILPYCGIININFILSNLHNLIIEKEQIKEKLCTNEILHFLLETCLLNFFIY